MSEVSQNNELWNPIAGINFRKLGDKYQVREYVIAEDEMVIREYANRAEFLIAVQMHHVAILQSLFRYTEKLEAASNGTDAG